MKVRSILTGSKVSALTLALATFGSESIDANAATLVYSHTGAVDPTTEGWGTLGLGIGVTTGPVINDLGTGVDAWFVDDSSLVLNSFIHYTQIPPPAIIAQANAEGWTLSVNIRMVRETVGPFDGIFADYFNGATGYQIVLDREADGDPTVSLLGAGGGSFTLEGVGDGDYHLYELVFDPMAGSADLFVDGVERLSDYTGQPGALTRVHWGAGGSASTGRGHFNSTRFSVGTANLPLFALRTDPLTINAAAAGYNGPNLAVQSSPGAGAFSVADFVEQINPGGGTVTFDLAVTENIGGALFAVGLGAPTVAAAGPGGANLTRDLTFTTLPGAAGIATIDISASVNGGPPSPPESFTVHVYRVRPFAGDLVIADRGPRVFKGAILLVHTSPAAMGLPVQNSIDDSLVDAYELAVITNATDIPGKPFLEYVVIDYETVVSAKGRGQQGLYGVNSVSQTRKLISEGQMFAVPLGVDLIPHGPNAMALDRAGKFAVADAELEPALSKIIIVDPAMPPGANQTLLTQGGELFFTTGITVAPSGSPNEGDIYVTDVGNLFGKTVDKNANPRKIVKINPQDGTQSVLVSEINDFTSGNTITNLYHPTGIDVDPVTGDLYIADSFSKVVWKLPGAVAGPLVGVSADADFLQPVHIVAAPNGGAATQFLYMTDGETVAPGAAYALGSRRLHKVDLSIDIAVDANNSIIFEDDGFFEEPRGVEVIPANPQTGN